MSPDRTTVDAPTDDWTIPGDGTVTFASSNHAYTVSPSRFGRYEISFAQSDGTVRHLDTFDVTTDLGRKRFEKEIRQKLDDATAETVKVELLAIAKNLKYVIPAVPARTVASLEDEPWYEVDNRGVFYERNVPSGPPVPTQVSNFAGRIAADILIDEGMGETKRVYELECWQGELRRTVTVSAEEFPALKWATQELGSRAVVFPGARHADIVVAAIQLAKPKPDQRMMFGHLGWTQLEDGQMGYLTASGAITGDGLRDAISVRLDPPLNRYSLPVPPAGDELKAAWEAMIETLEIAPRSVMMPLLCTLIRSIFEASDFALYLKAATGTGKTQLVGIMQSAYGARLGPDHLPGNFTSTGNSLEMIAHLAKDALLVIDDFQRNKANNADATAERIGRALGNQSGRARLTRDAKLRSERPPRGTVVMTGEDTPKGESLRARMMIIELSRNTIDWDQLTIAQRRAKEGVYALALSGFVSWVAREYPRRMADFAARFEELRTRLHDAHKQAHARSTTTGAHLMAALSVLLDFLEENGWDAPAIEAMEESAAREISALIDQQAAHLKSANPVTQFYESLESVIVSGAAHLAGPDGLEPQSSPQSWGWRKTEKAGYESTPDWRAQGERIGWVKASDEGIYLLWDAAFQLVQRRAVAIGNEYPLGKDTLLKRIAERGLLLDREENRGTFKIRRRFQGAEQKVIYLKYPVEESEIEA